MINVKTWCWSPKCPPNPHNKSPRALAIATSQICWINFLLLLINVCSIMLGKLINRKLLLKFNYLFLSTAFSFTVLILLSVSSVTFGINWIPLSQIFVTPESCMSKNKLTLYLVPGHVFVVVVVCCFTNLLNFTTKLIITISITKQKQ